MKVLYIGSDVQVCGAGFSMIKLVEELKKIGVNVVPVVRNGNSEKLLSESNIEHYTIDAQSWTMKRTYSRLKTLVYMIAKKALNVRCYYEYKRIIKKENPDIVHINALTTYVGAKAAIASSKPVVWHIREMLEEDFNVQFWNKKEAYELMRKASCFIAISKCVEEKYKKVVGAEKIKCIYNGVDKEVFFNPDHEIFVDDKIRITMAGRINVSKGQLSCMKSLAKILKENPNIVLSFAGTGDDSEIKKIKQVQKDYDIPDEQVVFLGFVKEMGKLWSETDIAVVYSRFEAFGRVTVEAKMAGALVVGFNSGGTTELIEDGVDGFLFDGDNIGLREVMLKILADKQSAKNIAVNGRTKAVNVFTSENNARHIVTLYDRILK